MSMLKKLSQLLDALKILAPELYETMSTMLQVTSASFKSVFPPPARISGDICKLNW